jgi:hypothetical protein
MLLVICLRLARELPLALKNAPAGLLQRGLAYGDSAAHHFQ